MELTVRVLCRPEVAAGFELAGLLVDQARDASATVDALKRLCGNPMVGVVLVEDALHRLVPDHVLQRLDRQALPVVAPLPSPRWDGKGLAEEVVLEILRQAIGYRVRPR